MSSAEKTETEEKASPSEDDGYNLSPEFRAAYAQTQKALTAAIPKKDLLSPLLHFAKEYLAASQEALASGKQECTAESAAGRIMQAIQFGIKYGTGEDKFLFGSSHIGLRGDPEKEDGNEIDFYAFGCDFFRSVIDTEHSLVMGQDNLKLAQEYLAKGENVVFFANHQSEADPQVMSVCLELADMEPTAENIVYVAGHKVTTDALAIPFSMGRNLICIHSKKHIDADPEMKPVKQRQNLASMGSMLEMLRRGGTPLWVAPSGGRDRRDLETGLVPPAPFDQKTIDMFRLMGNKSKVPTHYFPLAMVSYDLCPPPDSVEAGVGEQRNVRFVPVGINCGEELMSEGGLEKRHEFVELAMNNCVAAYDALREKMEL